MPRTIFVNLPVADLPRSIAFYKALGAEQNPAFSDDTAAMMSFSDTINVMLLTHEKFAHFSSKPIADARTSNEVLLALGLDSRAEVDAMVEKALAAGSREPSPVDEHGWMYGRSFEDPDGHGWGPFWMDAAAATAAMTGAQVSA
jgi:hypothetical protein